MAASHAPSAPIDVFIVDADPAQRRVMAGFIGERAAGRFAAHPCDNPLEALSAFRDGAIVIADVETLGGPQHLAELARKPMPLIATSGRASVNAAVAAVRAGAIDFFAKPIGAGQLIEKLEAAVSVWRNPKAVDAAPAAAAPATAAASESAADFAGFVGSSAAMRAVYDQILRMAPSRAPIFVTGESGTGKEVCAEAIHAHGGGGRPFVAINCSAIPKDLMESEIFGHVRGAFTGATENRAGAAELADGGTLFLDEIAEMDLGLQAKLLRFVQSGTLRRVGGTELKAVDVRIVAATNRDPLAEIEAGRFRADLFYRLHVLPIHLPPLRERRDDILPLATAFLRRYAQEENRRFRGFETRAADMLVAAPWPGNVRQLQNAIRRVVVLHDGERVEAGMLPGDIMGVRAAGDGPAAAAFVGMPFWQYERQIIEAAVAACAGHVGKAAAALEISPSTIYRKREAWAKRRAEEAAGLRPLSGRAENSMM